MLGILAECNKTCQRCDQTAHTANVDANQQLRVVACELGQQDRRGNVTDKLAGEDTEQQGAFLHQSGEKIPDGVDPSHISGKNKEKYLQKSMICDKINTDYSSIK